MSFAYAHIALRLFNTPLFYDERKAKAFLEGLGGRIAGAQIVVANVADAVDHRAFANGRPSAGIVGDRLGRSFQRANALPFDIVENVAIIPIEGTLVQKGGWVGSNSGETSYQGIQVQVAAARQAYAAKKIKGAVLEVDSYGGEVNGGFEAAAAIAQMSKEMPTLGILTDFAYSAGYLQVSQARQIVMPEFGGAGSIGVVMLHADYSDALDQAGVKVTIIRSGAKKYEGNSYEPLPADLAESWQAQADVMRDKFAATVAAGRGKRLSKAKALATEAQAYNAKDSLSLGLVDAIGDPSAAFDAFIREVNRS